MKATLTLPEPLALPTATQIQFTKVIIEMGIKQITVEYRFLDANNQDIFVPGSGSASRYWRAIDAPAADGQPEKTDYTDIFGFIIRSQDVGKKIGTGLWMLIWSKMKTSVLKVDGNDLVP
jgi:hypothetical protein